MKNWFRYFIYAVIIFAFVCIDSAVIIHTQNYVKLTFNGHRLTIVMLISNLLFGIILGLEHYIKERKNKGKWTFNIPRIIFLGIPSLVFGFYRIYYFYMNITLNNLMMSTATAFYSQIILGYVIITNFTKCDKV